MLRIGFFYLRPLALTLVAGVVASHAACSAIRGDLLVTGLRCEGLENPLGIESQHAKLSWHLLPRSPALRGLRQTAYHVLVASSLDRLTEHAADLWDSGTVKSDECTWIPYNGVRLPSASRCWWKVQVWDQNGRSSGWSQAAHWDTGLLQDSDWANAQWIAAPPDLEREGAPCFCKLIDLKPGWRTVHAFVCGPGYHELYINGRKADSRVLEPAQTEYPKRVFYSSYDVTDLLLRGRNSLGIMLGNGWYNQDRVWGGMSYGHPVLRLCLQAQYADGSLNTVVSDSSWQVAPGPVIANNIYAGETFDARRTIDWMSPKANKGAWRPVLPATGPAGRLMCPQLPPIRPVKVLQPSAPREIAPGVFIYDMKQNFAGWARLRIKAPAGTTIHMRFGEAVDAKTGALDTASTGVFATGVEQIDTYICRGGGEETWEPRFTYHGFRYVEVTGLAARSQPPKLEGIVVHTDVEPAGGFICSDAMLNRIHQAAVWTLVSNLHGHPTDCPARERCGWLGDAHGSAEMAAMNFDMSGFWTKYIDDIEAGWVSDLPPAVVPGKRIARDSGPIDWGVAVVMLPWFHWLYYGDRTELERCYPLMKRFVNAAAKTAKDGILSNGLGDWCPPGSVQPTATPVPLTTTAWFVEAARITAKTAQLMGWHEESIEFNALATRSQNALKATYYNSAEHSFGSQTADAMSLAFDLCPLPDRQAVCDSLARDVDSHGGHHTTGIFGSRWLFDTLAAGGHGDVAMTVMHKTDYPSIGYLFGLGATTFWECWGEPELDKKWGARSLNHPMQAAYDAWFMQGLGGIRCDPDGPGFRKVILRPEVLTGLQFVNTYHDSPSGRIRSDWERKAGAVVFHITIPPNTTATIELFLPSSGAHIEESGKPVSKAPGVRRLPSADRHAWFEVGSGEYTFTVR